MMNRKNLMAACVILSSVLLASCADPVDPQQEGEVCVANTWQNSCVDGVERTCVNGFVKERVCSANQVCLNGLCTTKGPDDSSEECNPATFLPSCAMEMTTSCQDGHIVKTLCKPNEHCNNNVCEVFECKPSEFITKCDAYNSTVISCKDWKIEETPCGANEYCEDGICYEFDADACDVEDYLPHCNGNTGLVCENGKIVRSICGEGFLCEEGVCIEDTSIVKPPVNNVIEEFVDGVWVLPILEKPFTTLQYAMKPYASDYAISLIKSYKLNVTQFDLFDYYGLGIEDAPGEDWTLKQSLLSVDSPKLSHKGKSIAYIWQTSDAQIIDEESPVRMEGVYMFPFSLASAYKPQSNLVAQIFATQVANARRISEMSSRPFDFVLATGDVTDNAQYNEITWFLTSLNGGLVNPDSGIDDDPVPGPNNDASDSFYSKGIGNIPWYPAIGNHDSMYLGFTEQTDEIKQAVVGDTVPNLYAFVNKIFGCSDKGCGIGYRDASKVEAPPVTSGTLPPDENRRMLSKTEMLDIFYNAPGLPKHHGLDRATIDSGWGYYSTYPIEGKPIRLVTLDTNSGTFSEVAMDEAQFEWLSGQIEDARSKDEMVIVQSHHCTNGLSGKVTAEQLHNLLASYKGMVLHICGHGHNNNSWARKSTAVSNAGYWEIMATSTVDFPSQTRIIEIVHEGKGVISIYVTNLDTNAPKGSLVRNAVSWAAARTYFASLNPNTEQSWLDEKEHRNMILRTNVPEAVWKNLDNYEWSDTIESETLLKSFEHIE